MLNDKKKILEKNEYLNERKNAKIASRFNKAKILYLMLSVFLCIAFISTVYFLTNYSNIKAIVIEGNVYLKDENILELSKISTSSKFLFTNARKIKESIKENGLINDCEVRMLDDQTINIKVEEKKIVGYAYEDKQNVLILEDDSRYVLSKDDLYLIGKVPLIEGFTKDKIILIEKNFNEVDYRMINEISEIHYYPELKFQDHEIIMRDGNYVFTSVYGLKILNKYYDIALSYTDGTNKCYYIEDISGNAYTSACPWEPISIIEKEDDDKETIEENVDEDYENE